MKYLRRLYYFFPLRLLLLHFKKHPYFIAIWLWFTLVSAGVLGNGYGVPSLFLDPEYLGEVGYISFAIIGLTFGTFLLSWNVTCYLLHSPSFPFMASLRWPFAMFFLNNSVIPIGFLVFYFVRIFYFQSAYELKGPKEIAFQLLGFLAGMTIILILATIYFSSTNKNILSFIKTKPRTFRRIKKKILEKREHELEQMQSKENQVRVDYYVTSRFNVRHTREIDHYEHKLLMQVFKQHHINALIAQLATLSVLVGLGYLIEYPAFQIPAVGSVFLLATLFIAVLGVFIFWTERWSLVVFIAFLFTVNVATRYDVFNHFNEAYGLDYSSKATYQLDSLRAICTDEQMAEDVKHVKGVLTNWRERNFGDRPWYEKPEMVIINASGGGSRSAVFTTAALQMADSLLDGELMKHTVMMTGASGGMYGIAYYRDLYLEKQLGTLDSSIYHTKFAKDIGGDLLNPILFTVITNDLFYPWQSFELDGYSYKKDRGYMMEKQLIRNVGGRLSGKISDYRVYEDEGRLPITIFASTIVNDSRRLFISAQPVSFLMRPTGEFQNEIDHEIDGIDFGRFFKDQDAYNLKLSSAIRMNSTYPFILPNVTLPSTPQISVWDAGARDNYGLDATVRFIESMADWINRNTSGVIVISVRGNLKQLEIEPYERKAFLARLFAPIGNLTSVTQVQDFNWDFRLNTAIEKLNGKLDVIRFEYNPGEDEKRAAMSLHLTTKEKNDLINEARDVDMLEKYEELRRLLK